MRTLWRDAMLRMLALAILLALLLPAQGNGRIAAEWAGNAAVFVLFLLNGMRIARSEVRAGLANWRFLFPLALWVFGAMAIAGLGLATLAGPVLPPVIALGFLYLGTLTSTVQSATSYSSLGGGDVALSVVSAALLNILGVLVTVPVFAALGGSEAGAIGTGTVVKILLLLVLPFAAGQALQTRVEGFVARHRHRIVWLDRAVIAIAVYVAFSGAVVQGIGSRVDGASWAWLVSLVAAFLVLGHGGAWLASGLLRLPRPARIAFLFAGAQKSAAVGAPLATVLFAPAEAGFIVLPLLLYHLFQLVIAAPLANRLRAAQPPDGDDCTAPTMRARGR